MCQDGTPDDSRPTLADAGIDKKLSAKAQKLAAVPEKTFNEMLGEWRGKIALEKERVTTNLLCASGNGHKSTEPHSEF